MHAFFIITYIILGVLEIIDIMPFQAYRQYK